MAASGHIHGINLLKVTNNNKLSVLGIEKWYYTIKALRILLLSTDH